MASAADIQIAMVMIEAFAAKKGSGAFTRISRQKVAEQLRARVRNPALINQGKAGLCPSASVVYSIAVTRPLEYVQAVINLYDLGRAKIGKWDIKPCKDLRSYPLPVCDAEGCPPPEADWIIMASIRDSENWFIDYEAVSDQGGAWGDEVAAWLRKAGFTSVLEDWHKTGHKDRIVLQAAENYYAVDYQVCLLINAAIIDWAWAPPTPRPNHWVVLASDIAMTVELPGPVTGKAPALPLKFPANFPPLKYSVKFQVFSWGRKMQVHVPVDAQGHAVPNIPLPLDTLLENFYGYVAAKY